MVHKIEEDNTWLVDETFMDHAGNEVHTAKIELSILINIMYFILVFLCM
jgi:hypothetical protein